MRWLSFPCGRLCLLPVLVLGMLGATARAELTIFDHPSAGVNGLTTFTGISNGRMTGFWSTIDGSPKGSFVYDNGVYTPLDYPGAASSVLSGISGNTIIGTYVPTDNPTKTTSFIYNGSTFPGFDYPSPAHVQVNTFAKDIDNSVIVGSYQFETTGKLHGFIRYPGEVGTYLTLDYPDSFGTSIEAISGQRLVGTYLDDGSANRGFLYENGNFSPLDFPGAAQTFPVDIDGNLITGYYSAADDSVHGFIYDGTTWTPFDLPNSTSTSIVGIESSTLVGSFADGAGTHAFATSVPEPASMLLIIPGLLTLGRRRRR